jgi:WD40 repeat protein
LEVGRFRAIAFSPRNNHLLSGSSDGMLRIWDPFRGGKLLWEIKHGPPVALVQFSPQGERLLSVGESGAVRIWDPVAESLLAEIPVGKSGAKDVRFAPDGESIAIAAQDGRLRIVNVADETTIAELPPDRFIESIAFSDDGQTLAAGSFGGNVRIWSASDWTLRHTYETNSGRIGDIEFVKDTALLAILASDGQLHLYDTAELVEIRKLKTHNLTDGVLARSGNGGFLAIGSGDGSVKLLQVEGLIRPNTFWHDTHVRAVGFLPNDKRLVAADGNGAVRLWNIETGRSQDLASGPSAEITTLSVHPEGRLIAAAGVAPHVALWDVVSGQRLYEIRLAEGGIAAVAFSFSGRQLAIATRHGGSFLYESEDWSKPKWKAAGSEAALHSIAFSPDDRKIVVGYEDGIIHFLDTGDGTQRNPSLHVPAIPLAIIFCGSGNSLAIGTDSGEIYLYDLATGRAPTVIKAHTSRVNSLAVFPGGATLVSGGRDKELRLWDTASGELLTSLFGHVRQVFSISVSSDGQTIASGGLEGDIRIWQAGR